MIDEQGPFTMKLIQDAQVVALAAGIMAISTPDGALILIYLREETGSAIADSLDSGRRFFPRFRTVYPHCGVLHRRRSPASWMDRRSQSEERENP